MRSVADLQELLVDVAPDVTIEEAEHLGLMIRPEPDAAWSIIQHLKEGPGNYDFMVDLFGMDTTESVLVTYHLRSLETGDTVYIRIELPYQALLRSIWEIFPAALMPEREVAEMFDLRLSGHPNPKRLLTTDTSEPWLLKRVAIRTRDEVRDR